MLIIFTRLIAIKIYVAFATVKAVSTHTEHGRCLFVICFCMWSFVTTQCGQTSVIFWTTFAGISRPFVNTFMLLFLLFSLEWAIAIFAIIFHLTFGTCSIKMSCATDLTCWRFCCICLAGSVDWCEGFTYWLNWFRTSLPVLLEYMTPLWCSGDCFWADRVSRIITRCFGLVFSPSFYVLIIASVVSAHQRCGIYNDA